MPGDNVSERLGSLLRDPSRRAEKIAGVRGRLNEFLGAAVALIRERFAGRVTYAAIPFEVTDWAPFDIVSVELIRSAEIASQFREGVRRLVAGGSRLRSRASARLLIAARATEAPAGWRSLNTTRELAPPFG